MSCPSSKRPKSPSTWSRRKKLEEKLRKNEFTLNDFLDQMAQIRNMGGAEQIMSMMPGMGKMKVPNQELDQKRMARMEAVVRSMTEQERLRPEIINASRKRRIPRGCGQQVSDVNRLLNQYESIRKMVRMMKGGRKGRFGLPFLGRFDIIQPRNNDKEELVWQSK